MHMHYSNKQQVTSETHTSAYLADQEFETGCVMSSTVYKSVSTASDKIMPR